MGDPKTHIAKLTVDLQRDVRMPPIPTKFAESGHGKDKKMIDTHVVGGINFFSGLTAGELRQISELCTIVKFKKGVTIFKRGESAEQFYIVRSGKVHLRVPISILLASTEIVVDVVIPGNVFGWSALVEPYQFTLSAYCDEESEIIQIGGKELLSCCARKHHVGLVLMGNLAKVIGSRMDRMQGLLEKEIAFNVPSF